MTLPRYKALRGYWAVVPPLNIAVAGIAGALGLKRSSAIEQQAQQQQGGIEQLAGLFGGVQKGKPQWLKAAEAAEAAQTST